MGHTFGFLRTQGGFRFTVLDACKAEGVNLSQACTLAFNNQELYQIGNITRGQMRPEPGIAGIGIWFAILPFFFIIAAAILLILLEVSPRTSKFRYGYLAVFRDPKANDPAKPENRELEKFRAAGRVFVLGTADTQTVFVGAFLLSFAGRTKCSLTSYHFTISVDQMMIALCTITFSVALVRTYWRNPIAAGLRLLLTVGAFIGVGLAILRKANFAPEFPPPKSRNDSAILLPVACLLELDLRHRAQKQAEMSNAEIGFGEPKLNIEVVFFCLLVVSVLIAHGAIIVRYRSAQKQRSQKWPIWKTLFVCTCRFLMLVPPTVISVWCWVRIYRSRSWVDRSGWIKQPNSEMLIWDVGQLIAMGSLVTVAMNIATELRKRDDKVSIEKNAKQKAEDEHSLLERGTERDVPSHGRHSLALTNLIAGSATSNYGYDPAPTTRELGRIRYDQPYR